MCATQIFEDRPLPEMVRLPWSLRVDDVTTVVRPSTARDLADVAVMHHRCSPRTLLGRYHLGGRQPSILAMDRMLREPLSFVVVRRGAGGESRVVATAALSRDPNYGPHAITAGVLVQDSWQRLGIGTELMTHLAGVAATCGFQELVAYPGLMSEAVHRLVTHVGTTRQIDSPDGVHLRTALPPAASAGLGPLRTGASSGGDERFLRWCG